MATLTQTIGAAAPGGFFDEDLSTRDPALYAALVAELDRQRDKLELIASENIVSRGVAGAGIDTHQQICGRLSGQTLLWRVRACRCLRADGHRSREAVVRRRLRQRPAAFRRAGQHGGAVRVAGARRHGAGHEPRPWRPPDARCRPHRLGPLVQRRAIWGAGRGPADRFRSGRRPRPRASPEADHRRRIGLSARDRFRPVPRHRGRGGRAADGGHGAHRRPRRGGGASLAGAARACCHLHHAQDAAGAAGGLVLTNDEAIAKKINSAVFPGIQGGPLEHVIAAKAAAFGEALEPSFRDYAGNVVANARALAETLAGQGYAIVSGGTDTHVVLVDLRPKAITGRLAEAALDLAGITCNKNGIPFDPEKPFVTSGIRLGSPALTTRGFGEAEFRQVGLLIDRVVTAAAADGLDGAAPVFERVRGEVAALCAAFPIYAGIDG